MFNTSRYLSTTPSVDNIFSSKMVLQPLAFSLLSDVEEEPELVRLIPLLQLELELQEKEA